MNDPHVEALLYRVEHGACVDYDKAKPLEHDTPIFNVLVEKSRARFELNEHYATREAAREVVEPFIRAWELNVGLEHGPERFRLVYERTEIIDRNPTPGSIHGGGELAASQATVHAGGVVTAHPASYPRPPMALFVNPDVKKMYEGYMRYCQGRDRLGVIAAICLGVLEDSLGTTNKRRRKAAKKYHISPRVLDKLGYLAATKGGTEARKAVGAKEEFTSQEKMWIVATIKAIIRRAAEVAYDPRQYLPQITLAGLPPLDRKV
jgi:hypothetical protein